MKIPTPSPSLPDGPLSRHLLDPGGTTRRALQAVKHWLTGIVPFVIVVLVIVIVFIGLIMFLRWWRDRRLGNETRRIRIMPPPTIDPSGALNLWMALHALIRPWWRRLIWGQPHIAWEVSTELHDATVAIWVPATVPPGLVEQAVESSWPGARVEAFASDVGIPVQGYTSTCELTLREYEGYPLGEGAGGDRLRIVLGALGRLAPDEHALVQVLARPAGSAARLRLRQRASRMRRRETKRTRQAGARTTPVFPNPTLDTDVRAILAKAADPLWHATIHIAVTTSRRDTTRGKIHAIAGAFSVFEGRNGFRRRRVRGGIRAIEHRRMRRSSLLSASELEMIATLPSPEALPFLDRARARTVPAPKDLPWDGHVVGVADHPSLERPVAIAPPDFCHHVHLLGETGTGKSTLIANLVLSDARAGRAAVVIDPKGDLIETILERLPDESIERTCVLEPEDDKRVVGLNMLAGENPDLVVDHIVSVFKRLYESAWGARTDDIMRAACLTLAGVPGATLAEIPLLLTNREWRAVLRSKYQLIAPRDLGTFWDWYEQLGPQGQATNTAPLMNKIRSFTLRGPVVAVVGQAHPKLDIDALLESGGLLLVRIPKGTLGEETSRLIGSFVVSRVWQTCMQRARRHEVLRAPVTLYVDEMHNYLALPRSFEDMLAEARGYRLSLVLAHQHMGQLDRAMRDALAANARTKIAFTCSPDDATTLEKHFRPYLTEHDLANLGLYQAACRPCIGGTHGPAFTFRSAELQPADLERARVVRDESGRRFAEPRERVAADIAQRQGEIESRAREIVSRSAAQFSPQSPAQSPPRSRSSQPRRRGSAGGEP